MRLDSPIEARVRGYRLSRGAGHGSLAVVAIPRRPLRDGEIRIRIHAVALNYRDLLVAEGRMGAGESLIPASDAAGEVIEVADDVTRFRVGDRVSPLFFPDWIDGPPTASSVGRSLGGNTDGVLAEEVIAQASACVAAPDGLTWAEAATLPCAGLTAWTALFEAAQARAGQLVVIQGTGSVSVWALQLAKAAGLRALVLSGCAMKLERARQLGADDAINYRELAHWDDVVNQRHGGADIVLDVAGADTIARSLAALRPGGVAVTIGGVSGGFALQIPPFALIGQRRLTGAMVGSRASAEAFASFVTVTQLRPIVAREYAFMDAPRAYEDFAAQERFGRLVIRCDR